MNLSVLHQINLSLLVYGLFAASIVLLVYAMFRWSHNRTTHNTQALKRCLSLFILAGVFSLSWISLHTERPQADLSVTQLEEIPVYEGTPYTIVNSNQPFFTEEEKKRDSFVFFSELDELGRCSYAMGMLDRSMMPEEERGEIETVKPSGYHNAYYEGVIEDGFLYNRCHLIGFQFTGENANEKNLITGTRYMNVEGMEPFENEAAYYLRRTKNHLLLRVTPVFVNDELVCRGVLIEAYSVEDHGQEISFCVFCHNVQPGIEIDYQTGYSTPAKQ
ncbi:MAG: DNA/RNA non-specific endonuclease [Erysipelotrichaceae bacterium]|nr:DNA/RNA non-specific endonuclease [Erysipelotrichaceae bacterium]